MSPQSTSIDPKTWFIAACCSGLLAACGFGDNLTTRTSADARNSTGPGPDGHQVVPGADASHHDGGHESDGPQTVTTGAHVLISEVGSLSDTEFVEIYNPTNAAIDLSTYYLSDVNDYWKLPGVAGGSETITLLSSDFLQRFPTGTMIASAGVIVIAMDGDGFFAEYAVEPQFIIDDPGSTTGVSLVQTIANTGHPTITDGGEMVVLFHWDGASDLVEDVDLVVTGQPIPQNAPIAKQPVDGPDADDVATAYEPDALTIGEMQSETTVIGTTYKRIALEGVHEVHTGGNGVTGDDETSEQIDTTWDSNTTSSYTFGTPGSVPSFE